jgi:hypothetical protein
LADRQINFEKLWAGSSCVLYRTLGGIIDPPPYARRRLCNGNGGQAGACQSGLDRFTDLARRKMWIKVKNRKAPLVAGLLEGGF